jgi:organic radical activating enzyme
MPNIQPKYFPIQQDPACLLKWAWSTIYLGRGTSSSCHRTDQRPIPPDALHTFHNLPNKIQAREMMRRGEWPREGCQYCEKIEKAGGVSDRQYQFLTESDRDRTPRELLDDPTVNEVVPTILEVYFNNTCNMSCLYCGSHFSSKWEEENRRFGVFKKGPVYFGENQTWNPDYEQMLADFWTYLRENNRYLHIRQFQMAGGEPFFQKEFEQNLDFWERHPNPDLTLNMITNLKVPSQKFQAYIDRIGDMVRNGKLQRLQISSSLDCWGPQQEYVRHGLDLNEWVKNFEYLLDKPFVTQCINSAISTLTIKTLPELVEKLNHWNRDKSPLFRVNFSFMTVMAPEWMDPAIFGSGVFDDDFDRVLSLMKKDCDREESTYQHLLGIKKQIAAAPRNHQMITGLINYLDEIDRRRGLNWRPLFPWLDRDWFDD